MRLNRSGTMDTAETLIPLRKWIAYEGRQNATEQQTRGQEEMVWLTKTALLRKTTVAYGIVELLRHAKIASDLTRPRDASPNSKSEAPQPAKECNIDNFVVRLSGNHPASENGGGHPPWNNVGGVCMVSPALSARITEPSFLSSIVDANVVDDLGRYVEVAIVPSLPRNIANIAIGRRNEGAVGDDCNLFGVLLYELYSGIAPFPADLIRGQKMADDDRLGGRDALGWANDDELARRKKTTVRYDKRKGKSYSRTLQRKPYASLQELGFPSSVSGLVLNLIDGHDSYAALEAASADIHLLLSDPPCFLFDLHDAASQGGSVQLSFREHKLYGREKEVSLITDAFCRVSSGKNEAIFIGGFSGSGKTKLVQNLTARVNIAGGYVLTEKVDQMHKERPLLGILSAFNNLCSLIRDKSSPQELSEVAQKLRQYFESDFSVLARLLPNIDAISTHQKPTAIEKESGNQMNFQNICFILQRFMRVVSSQSHPVMLFLDDIQWCGITSLELIYAILSDRIGSSCFFFVGSFRDNECNQEHPLFTMMYKLDSSGVPTTKLSLEGLTSKDLNTMISDATCTFPRICQPLSDIVFEKTKGNPFFVIEFLRSLVDSRLLKYSLRQKVWIWDENKIRSENITDNVLYLLSRKMTSFQEHIQLALKVLSCFGIQVDGAILEYLSSTLEYSNFQEWLQGCIREGCIQKVGTSFKFVHDKVREVAYNLIPDNEKSQFHYNLGSSLYSVSREQDLGGAIFHIVDQMNHGIKDSLIQPTMQHNVVELNFDSGSRAMDQSDYETSHSYFINALLLLPNHHWSSNYEFSLRLFLLTAKAAYACGKIEKAYGSLKEILAEGRCFEDKLDAYGSYVSILTSEGRIEAWATCCEVLSKLKETIPDSFDVQMMGAMVKQTRETLERISDDDLLAMQEMDSVFHNTLKFYTLLLYIAFWKKPQMMTLISCRMVKFTLTHGVSKESIFGFVQYAANICHQSKEVKHIQEACRIGKAAMSLLKRFGSNADIVPNVYLCYYGFVAPHSEPLRLSVEKLRKGFEVGMSAGHSSIALYNTLLIIKTAVFCGNNLHAVLLQVDYYLEVMNRIHNKLLLPYLLNYRETIVTLIGHSIGPQSINPFEGISSSGAGDATRLEATFMNRTIQAFWCGYSQRCHHYAKKMIDVQTGSQNNRYHMHFLRAINSFRGVKNNNGNGSQFLKVKATFKDAITILRRASELSPWTFQNKVYLLEAEMFSFERKNAEARSSYAAAITSSTSQRFVHEQGLACELAGMHYNKIGEGEIAMNFLQRAKECYQQWGSQMKVESITEQMGKVVSASLT